MAFIVESFSKLRSVMESLAPEGRFSVLNLSLLENKESEVALD